MSFAKAAEELFVTPAALSYQIKSLEEHLGVPLFRRLNRAVELTEAGHALRPGLATAFREMLGAVRAVERLKGARGLTITAGPAFTAKWLAPRLFGFAMRHPEIELSFVASLRIMDFDRDGIDAAIRFSAAEPDGLYSEVLVEDWVIPVATPEIARRLGAPDAILGETLLHDDSIRDFRPRADWRAWFEAAGVAPGDAPEHGLRFSNADHAIDAAVEGAGVVLARATLAERDLNAGRLAIPVPIALPAPGRFMFVCRQGAESEPRIATLLGWMRDEIRSVAALRDGIEFRAPR
jgi:LysR family glycine cleavage system transcriptional activator